MQLRLHLCSMQQLFGWLKGKISRDGRNKSTHSSCKLSQLYSNETLIRCDEHIYGIYYSGEIAQLETNEQEFSNLLTIGTLGDQYLNTSNYHLGKPPPFSSPPLPQDGHLHHEDSYQSLSPEEVEKLQQDSIDLLDSDDLPDSNKLKLVRKGIDHCMDADKKATLQKKLSSFLLKKVLACRRSFSPVPDLRTPSESLEPRMGKVKDPLL